MLVPALRARVHAQHRKRSQRTHAARTRARVKSRWSVPVFRFCHPERSEGPHAPERNYRPEKEFQPLRFAPQSILTMELTVYSAAWCPDCREAKRFLAKYNVPFKEVDVETSPGAIDEIVKRTGKRAIPQFVIDGEWVQPYRPGEGFLYEEMAKRLGIKKL